MTSTSSLAEQLTMNDNEAFTLNSGPAPKSWISVARQRQPHHVDGARRRIGQHRMADDTRTGNGLHVQLGGLARSFFEPKMGDDGLHGGPPG